MNRPELKQIHNQTPEEVRLIVNKLRNFVEVKPNHPTIDLVKKALTDMELRLAEKIRLESVK